MSAIVTRGFLLEEWANRKVENCSHLHSLISFHVSFISVRASYFQACWYERRSSNNPHSLSEREKTHERNRQYYKRIRGNPVLYEMYLARKRRNQRKYDEKKRLGLTWIIRWQNMHVTHSLMLVETNRANRSLMKTWVFWLVRAENQMFMKG